MLVGYPDYFGQSIYFKFGTPTRVYYGVTDGIAGSYDVIDITKKGKIICGGLYISGDSDLTSLSLTITVDGIAFFTTTFSIPVTTQTIYNKSAPIYFKVVDNVNYVYSWDFLKDISFDQSLKITVTNNSTTKKITILFLLYYAEVV